MRTELLMRNAIWRLRCVGCAVAMLRGSAIRVTNSNTVSTNPATWAGVMDAMFMLGPHEPRVWLRLKEAEHFCVIVHDFAVRAVNPQIVAVAVRLHVPDAVDVLDNGTDRKTVKRCGEGTEDNGWVDRHVRPFL